MENAIKTFKIPNTHIGIWYCGKNKKPMLGRCAFDFINNS